MRPRAHPILLAVLASPLFVPVSCTSVMLPVAHGFSYAETRDLTAGEPLYVTPAQIPLVDRTAPKMSIALPAEELPAALERWPGLTPRLPRKGSTQGPGKDFLFWHELSDGPDGQLIELRHENLAFEHTIRYRATDKGVVLVSSRLFSDRHWHPGFVAGLVCGVILMLVMRRIRKRATA